MTAITRILIHGSLAKVVRYRKQRFLEFDEAAGPDADDPANLPVKALNQPSHDWIASLDFLS
ncbi:MAG: hypothetical protein WBW62_04690 [Solirubrobacterales bacterium]